MSSNGGEFSRRQFNTYASLSILAILSAGIGYFKFYGKTKNHIFKGNIIGANAQRGHLIRQGKFPVPSEKKQFDTVIVGGGIAGLSAAWWLKRNNYDDFILLELDQNAGGNSNSGKNEVSAYPWGAHYVPLPALEAEYVRLLFEEVGIITGYQKGLPVYNEFFLCADPHERLYFQGKWQESMIPQHGIPDSEKKQFDEFFHLTEKLKNSKGKDGKRAFVIPLDLSSSDPEFTRLDKISMADFMISKGWTSRYLNWYVNYCCRDDFGETHDKVSAWAGFHYFASRVGKGANADSQSVLTWPEGNGWLVKRLEERNRDKISKNCLVYNIKQKAGQKITVNYFDINLGKTIEIETNQVIYAAPRFTAPYIIKESEQDVFIKELTFRPWLVANLTLTKRPGGLGQELSWDNVSFYSSSLGYVVATNQDISRKELKTVITYYTPLNEGSPAEVRKKAKKTSHQQWAGIISADLEKIHPGISDNIENIDVWVWGHGMVSPGLNYICSEDRQKMLESCGNIHFAHTDMSGISIFEEAQYRGIMAAKKILQKKIAGIT